MHRYAAIAPLGDATSPAGAIEFAGGAVGEFASASAALRSAFAAPDPAALAAPLARLAAAACDLADPFLTTAPDADELAGARGAFAELFDAAAFDSLSCDAVDATDLNAAAIALASVSEAQRSAAERVVLANDDDALGRLRAERLRAALALAAAVARQAYSLAGVEATELHTPAALSIWPNPAAGAVRVAFSLPAAGLVRVEIIDVTGRMRWTRELGARSAGAQSLVLDAASVDALPTGTYFVRIHARDTQRTGRLVRIAR